MNSMIPHISVNLCFAGALSAPFALKSRTEARRVPFPTISEMQKMSMDYPSFGYLSAGRHQMNSEILDSGFLHSRLSIVNDNTREQPFMTIAYTGSDRLFDHWPRDRTEIIALYRPF